MEQTAAEAPRAGLRAVCARRFKREFHGLTVTLDAGLLAFRELADALSPGAMDGEVLAETRTGRNGRRFLAARFRECVFR